ncbi:hypothetical protein [Segeticoccus rhizosphaerae]|nr:MULTISPECIES: hypothetical protein [Intrasporangiaceae]
MKSQTRHAGAKTVTTRFQRWLEQNRAYGEVIERYAHPGKKG